MTMSGNAIAIKKSLIQINVCVLLLGVTSLFAKLITLPADVITLYRSIFGSLALAVLIWFTRTPFRLESSRDYILVILTGLLTGVHWVTFFHANPTVIKTKTYSI